MDTLLPLIGLGLLIVSFGFVATFWFRAMKAYEKLVRYEYENLPERWEKDGQPAGFPDRQTSKQRIKQTGLSNKILGPMINVLTLYKFTFKTPAWIRENPEALIHIKELRKFVLLWCVGVIVWFFIIFPAVVFAFTPK